MTTPRLGMPEIATGQDNIAPHNDALDVLELTVQAAVKDKDLTAPPGSPADGDMYIVGAAATGAWSGHDKAIAKYRSGWKFFPAAGSPGAAHEGLTVYVQDEDKPYVYSGSAWTVAGASIALDDLSDVAITAAAQGNIIRRNGSNQWVNEKPPVWIGTDRSSGAPSASAVMLDRVVPAEIVLPASMTGSVAEASVAATAETDFDVQRNGSSVATIRFAAAGTSASFINAGADTFAAGDNLRVVAPATPDATLADIVMTLAFTRS